MDKELTVWYCDVCKEAISNTDNALITWESNDEHKCFDFKIAHKNCANWGTKHSCELSTFLGSKGLAVLTSMLSRGKALEANINDIKDMDEFVDLIRRLQLPYYEEARKSFGTFDVYELFGRDAHSVYLPENLKKIIEENIGGEQ
jgi:hypothetical protein